MRRIIPWVLLGSVLVGASTGMVLGIIAVPTSVRVDAPSRTQVGSSSGQVGMARSMGTVKGILYVGMDPNLLVGVGPNAGIPGTVTATAKSGVAHSFHVSSDGKFTLRLPPGTYTLTGVSPRFHDGAEICETPEPSFHLVTVKAGQSAFAGVVCTVDPLPSSQN